MIKMAAILTRDQQKAMNTGFGPMEDNYLLNPGKYRTLQPKASAHTIVRVYPEHFADGTTAPMILGTPEVPGPNDTVETVLDISNMLQQDTVALHGLAKESYFTGLTSPSDRAYSKFDRVFGGTFMKLKKKYESRSLPPEVASAFAALLVKRENMFGKSISGPESKYFIRCAIERHNGEVLTKAAMNGLLIISGTAAMAYSKAIARAHEAGIDLFDAAKGYPLSFGFLPMDASEGRQTPVSTCVRGRVPYNGGTDTIAALEANAKPAPIPAALIKLAWTDLEKEFKFHTWRHLMQCAIACYGAVVVNEAYPTQYAEYMAEHVGVKTVATQVKPVTAAAPTPPADMYSDPYGAQVVAAPTVVTPKTVTTAPKAPVIAPKVMEASADDMTAAYEAMLADVK